jgi:hypothetical protein
MVPLGSFLDFRERAVALLGKEDPVRGDARIDPDALAALEQIDDAGGLRPIAERAGEQVAEA